jgi:2'-5' RNA ligase
MNDGSLRLFIALPLPDSVKEALGALIAEFGSHPAPVKWLNPANIHMTLRFLGDTPKSRVTDLSAMLNETGSHHSTVSTSISRLGAFPNLRRARVLWAGVQEDHSVIRLEHLAAEIERGVQQLGFEPESKKFRSHLTIGRVKQRASINELAQTIEHYRLAPIPLTLSDLVLFQSTLTPRGPIYKRLHRVALGEERFSG